MGPFQVGRRPRRTQRPERARSWSAGTLAILAVLAGCGSAGPSVGKDSGAVEDPGVAEDTQAQADAGTVEDTETGADPGSAEDVGAGDTGDRDTPDAAEPPRPEAVHEVRNRASPLPDGPWTRDRACFPGAADGLPPEPVRALAFSRNTLWVAGESGLRAGPPGGPFHVVPDPDRRLADVRDLAPRPDGGVLATTPAAILEVGEDEGPGRSLAPPPDALPIDRAVPCGGTVFALGGGLLLEERAGNLIPPADPAVGQVRDIACRQDSLLVLAEDGLFVWPSPGSLLWQPAPEEEATRLHAAGPAALLAGPDLAVRLAPPDPPAVLRPEPGGIPTRGLTALSLSPSGRSLALGHPIGASWLDPGSGRVDHYASPRWLPSDQVTALAFESDEALWVGTSGGLVRIAWEDIDLEAKARRMFGQLERWFVRLDGFVSPWARFPAPDVEEPASLHDDDNDGQWTQEAVGAFCLAFAVTGEEAWRTAARKAARNMALLIDVPARDFEAAGLGRGFVARSVVRDDEGAIFADKATQSNWHRTTFDDGHDYYWKDDTSSDEVTGHLFGWSLFHDLCAQDDEERAFAGRYLGDLAGYLLRHGYRLLDLDGLPTTHGDYSPDRIPIAVDGLEACADAGHPLDLCLDSWGGGAFLDSVEVLALMLAAWHATGEDRFLRAYEDLAVTHRYQEAATFHPNVVTWTVHSMANYCDHELADLAFYVLLRYEPHPDRRAHWIAQMMAAWEYEVGERNPLKAMTMASALQEAPGLAEAVRTLVLYPEDLREWPVDNSHRRDYLTGGTDRAGRAQFLAVPPHDEIAILRWDHNPYRVSGHGDGASRMAPSFWLLPYWGLRYHGVLVPETRARPAPR